MGKWLRIFYIGPESRVYHTHRGCPRINNRARYYPLRSTSLRTKEGVRIYNARRLCRTCAAWKPVNR